MMRFAYLRKPDPRLAEHVDSFAIFASVPGVRTDLNYLSLPCVFSHLCFTLLPAGDPAKAHLWLMGPQGRLSDFPLEGVQTIGARIYPGGLGPLFGIPGHVLRDQYIPLERLWGDGARVLTERLWEAATGKKRMGLLEEALLERLAPSRKANPLVLETAKLAQQGRWTLSIRELAGRLGYSSRQLHNQFTISCGFSPKEYLRILRCRLLSQRILRTGGLDWQELVHDYGYYDQAHFIHDFKEMMKQTPGQFVERMGRNFNRLDSAKVTLEKTENDRYLGSDESASVLITLGGSLPNRS